MRNPLPFLAAPKRRLLAALLAALTVGSCAVGPDYQRPPVAIPVNWWRVDGAGTVAADIVWWELFRDPTLNQLIQSALANNKDIQAAAAAVEEFYGRYRTTRSFLFPQVSYDALGENRQSAEIDRAPGSDSVADRYQADVGIVDYELDFWGRLRRATEAARADLLATEEAKRTVILTLAAAVADSYMRLLDLDQRLGIARNTLGTREESVRIARRRFEAGVTSELPYRQAQADYQQVAVTIPQLERQIAEEENLLNVLLGRNPGPIPRDRRLDQLALPGIPAGLPSELLERRPDILGAEQELIAANARIGVAKAQYFPTISLTGLVGGASGELSSLFSGSGRTWSFGGTVLGPIFTAGNIAGQVQSAEARQQQALARYEKAIQTAFAEVETGLISTRKTREELEAQIRQVEALNQYARLARLRYDNGYVSYLEVVDAERNLFDAELSLAQSQSQVYRVLINLYKAMGGGWVAQAEKLTVSYGPPVASLPGQAAARQ